MTELVKAQISFHPWIGSNPSQNIKILEAEAYKLNLISKIFFASIAVISLTVVASSFFFTSVSMAIAFPLTCSVVATPCLAWASSQFQAECMKVRQIIERELPVAKFYEQIQNFSSQEILEFLNSHNIPIPFSIELTDLIPVIARFLARQEQSRICFENAEKLLRSSGISDPVLRLYQRNLGWNLLERNAIPFAIEGAFALQVLKEPTLEGTLSTHFTLLQKSFEERQFDQRFGPKDPYLTFRKTEREPMDLEAFVRNPDPTILNYLLFYTARN